MVSTVAEMSGNRVDVSIGTGWNVGEHESLGLTFESQKARFDRLDEYIQVLLGLWGAEEFDFRGEHYAIAGILPRPLPQPRPRIIVGGHGRRKTPLLAARYADDYNIDWPSPAQCVDLFGRLESACAEVGRDASTIERSALLGVMVGTSAADVRRIVSSGVQELGGTDTDAWLADNGPAWVAGTPDRILEWLREYEAAGVQHAMLMTAPHTDVSSIHLLAREVLPAMAGGSVL